MTVAELIKKLQDLPDKGMQVVFVNSLDDTEPLWSCPRPRIVRASKWGHTVGGGEDIPQYTKYVRL